MDRKIKEEAEYCLNCKTKPCSQKGCPLENDIPTFINYLKEEKYEEAYNTLIQTAVLPSICGRICPHYKQCMRACTRGIRGEPVRIGTLEAFVGDIAIKKGYKIVDKEKLTNNKENINKEKKIAIIGGGPAGITAAAFLAMKGNKVTIYEKYDYLGGLLIHGIPEFRLSRDIIKQSIKKILELGIEVKYKQELGKNLKLEDLQEEYDKIILAFGSNISLKMGIEGEDLKGVYGGNELLEYNSHPNYKGKTVVVVGGGNVAIDTSRTIKKLGAENVIIVYRRERAQMPAEQKEVEDALNEGIQFLFKTDVTKIIGKKQVEKVELIKTKLIQKDGEERPYPINIKNSNYIIDTDYVIMAIGSQPSEFVQDLGLEIDKKGKIKTNENGQTSNPKIYAVGDLAGNKSTVAYAAKSGREVATSIGKT